MKIKTFVAGTVNAFTLASFVGVGAVYWDEAKAEQALMTISDDDRHCLQQNIYFEARNQSTLGKVAVAWVTINRMESSRYPDTICGVVKQGYRNSDGSMKRGKCQFSWYCDGKSDRVSNNVVEQKAWKNAKLVADVVLIDWARARKSPVDDAVMYHADYVTPYWASSYSEVTKVDDHIFYN